MHRIILIFLILFQACTAFCHYQDTIKSSFLRDTVVIIFSNHGDKKINKKISEKIKNLEQSFDRHCENSVLNQANKEVHEIKIDSNFYAIFNLGKTIFELTGGAFDPSKWDIMRIWQFHEDSVLDVDFLIVDSLLSIPGMSQNELKVVENNGVYTLFKPDTRTKFAFEGILSAYALNVLEQVFIELGTDQYFIKIGNDFIVNGDFDDNFITLTEQEIKGFCGNIGIRHPQLSEKYGISYSQSIRKFLRKDGTTCSHTIDTQWGFPLSHNLLTVTIYSSDPVLSDGLATAFMVMGLSDAVDFLEKNKNLNVKASFIYQNESKGCVVKNVGF